MGKELAEVFPVAREIFERVDESLQQNLSKMIFWGESVDLMNTSNAQPAIMAVSMAALKVVMDALVLDHIDLHHHDGGAGIAKLCLVAAGHSLGEYSAICAAASISLEDTAKLLRIRGNAMQEAVPLGKGAMLALLGVDLEIAEKIAAVVLSDAEVSTPNGVGGSGSDSGVEVCQVANDNGAGQFVLSGTVRTLDKAADIAGKFGCRKTIKLQVSAPFHSSLMEMAADAMRLALQRVKIADPKVPIIANYTGRPNNKGALIPDLLVKQIPGMVRWRETIDYMVKEMQIDTIVEVGPGKVLSSIAKKMYGDLRTMSVHTPGEVDALVKALTL